MAGLLGESSSEDNVERLGGSVARSISLASIIASRHYSSYALTSGNRFPMNDRAASENGPELFAECQNRGRVSHVKLG